MRAAGREILGEGKHDDDWEGFFEEWRVEGLKSAGDGERSGCSLIIQDKAHERRMETREFSFLTLRNDVTQTSDLKLMDKMSKEVLMSRRPNAMDTIDAAR